MDLPGEGNSACRALSFVSVVIVAVVVVVVAHQCVRVVGLAPVKRAVSKVRNAINR
jgi:hypothetical protein